MGQVVFGVGEYKIRVTDCIVSKSPHGFASGRNPRRSLGRFDSGFASSEAYKTLIKLTEPRAQDFWSVPGGISCHEDQLDLLSETRGHFLQPHRDIRHMEGALIGAPGI